MERSIGNYVRTVLDNGKCGNSLNVFDAMGGKARHWNSARFARLKGGDPMASIEQARPLPGIQQPDIRVPQFSWPKGWKVAPANPANTNRVLPPAHNAFNTLVRRGLGALGAILAPSPLGDASNPFPYELGSPEYSSDDALRDMMEAFTAPEPEPFYWHPADIDWVSPKTVILPPPPSWVVDPRVFPLIPSPLTPVEIPTVPEFERAAPQAPEILPVSPPVFRPPAAPSHRGQPAPLYRMNVEFDVDGSIRIRQSQQKIPRWERARRDGKAKSWYVQALALINKTWGNASEVLDFAQAIIQNTYVVDAQGKPVTYRDEFGNERRVRAMSDAYGSPLEVVRGIAHGQYEVDIFGALADFALQQSMDKVIGRGSKVVRDSGMYDYGNNLVGYFAGPAL